MIGKGLGSGAQACQRWRRWIFRLDHRCLKHWAQYHVILSNCSSEETKFRNAQSL